MYSNREITGAGGGFVQGEWRSGGMEVVDRRIGPNREPGRRWRVTTSVGEGPPDNFGPTQKPWQGNGRGRVLCGFLGPLLTSFTSLSHLRLRSMWGHWKIEPRRGPSSRALLFGGLSGTMAG